MGNEAVKPSDFHVGVIDLFAILLPGCFLTLFLVQAIDLDALMGSGDQPFPGLDVTGRWIAFLLASYTVGHFVFLIASRLDRIYDRYRRWLWPDEQRPESRIAVELKNHALASEGDADAMDTFSWAKSVLTLGQPAALATVKRLEADSKFFRSFVVVLLILGAVFTWKVELAEALVCFLLAGLAFVCFAARRYMSSTWAYRFVICLERQRRDGKEDRP
jgi:hypothetical protein